MVPGAGLVLLGRVRAGLLLAGSFLLCFGAALGWFLISYIRYLNLAFSDELLKGDTLERIGDTFPRVGLLVLAGLGIVLHLVSMAMFQAATKDEPMLKK